MSGINNLVKIYSQQLSDYTLLNLLDRESARLRNEALIAKNRAVYNLNKCSQYAALLIKRIRLKKLKKTRIWSKVEKSRYWEEEVPKFDDHQFQNTFRISRNTFNYIKNRLKHLIRQETKFRSPITLDKRLAICLYALGSSAEYRSIASLFGVGRTTVGEIVREICQEIFSIFKSEYLNTYPPTPERIKEIVRGFEVLGFPQCFGAIGSCHIEVHPPKKQVLAYYNYNRWYSVIILAVVDYRHRFTYINVGSPGTMDDSRIFEKSKLKIVHQSNPLFKNKSKVIEGVAVPVLLIGDSAFRISDILLKPYTVVQSNHERIFNYQLSNCRKVVENAFGQIKARFRRIGKGLDVSINNVNNIIRACCIMHNICNERKDAFDKTWLKEFANHQTRIQPQTRTVEDGSNGNTIRNAIATFLARRVDGIGGTAEMDDNTVDVDTVDILSLKSEN